MNKATVIFDLDGTLVDIAPVFFGIYNTVASKFGLAPLLESEIPSLKKLHMKQVMLRRLGWRVILFPWIIRSGQAEYHRLIPEVALFPGIRELCDTLHARGYRLGIVSSSREDTIRSLVERHALPIDFLSQSSLFNKAATLSRVLAQEQISPSETIYIGDELRDIEACRKSDLPIIAVTWGLNDRQALIDTGVPTADTTTELEKEILLRLPL